MLKRILLLLGLCLGLLIGTPQAEAQNSQPSDDEVNRIAKNLYCPVCENIPLDVCGTVACAQWRETIREKLAEGWSERQISDHFVTLYGERVLARPSTNGLTLLIWVLPPLALLAGAVAWWRFLRGARKSAIVAARTVAAPNLSPAPAADRQPPDPYLARMEHEFKHSKTTRGTP